MGKKRGAGLRSRGHKVHEKGSRAEKKKELQDRREGRHNAGKDFGVPDLAHEKKAMQRTKAFKRQQRQRIQKGERSALFNQNRKMLAPSLDAITARAKLQTNKFVKKEAERKVAAEAAADVSGSLGADNSRKAYMRELRKTVASADVILEVLDARDPQGCRCQTIEDGIAADPSKKLILVLNKTDLVPVEVVQGWVKHLKVRC